MKKIILIMMLVIMPIMIFCGCDKNNNVLRIHIRANSNMEWDQDVKLKVRDDVVNYITPMISDCEDCEGVKMVLNKNLNNIESVANDVLIRNGFDYGVEAKINNEYFPSRDYDGRCFPADYYDALVINLGSGKGDNWWCVAYPPLCFVGEGSGNDVQYKSKLLEMINNFFGG